jgi:hypothetical protein
VSDIGVIIDLDDQSIDQGKVVLDYTSRDFNAIRAQLVGLAKGLMPDWQTAGEPSDMGTLILELFAYMGDVLHFYIDRTASEAFLSTALRQQSVLYIADMMGYVPIGQQAASVALTFTIEPDDPDQPGTVVPVTIPVGTRIYNEVGNADEMIVFELATDVKLDPKVPDLSASPPEPDRRSVVAYANEGLSVKDFPMGTSSGLPNTELVIPDKGVIYATSRVLTREGTQVTEWTYVSHLSSARPTQAVFTTFLDETGLTHIIFGDNAAGRIPPVNAQFFVSYRYGVGAAANALSSNSLTAIANTPGVDLGFVSVTNRSSPVGGTDPESVESMRYSISRGGSRLRQRAVTLNDYAELAMQVPGVAKSVAYGAVYTAVHVRVAPIGGKADANYMQRLMNSVYSYMSDKIMIGSQVYPEPTDVETLFQDVQIRILIHVMDAYDRSQVRIQTDAVVRTLLDFNNVDFGSRVSVGLIYRAVLAVQGVEYADLQWLSTEPPPNEKALGTTGVIDPDNATSLVLMDDWNYSTSTTIAAPGDTNVRLNNATNPTTIALSTTAAGPTSVVTPVTSLKVGDHVVISALTDTTKWLSLIVMAAPTITAVTLVAEVQTVTPTGTISGGTFTMTLLGVTTGPIAWNATAANIKTAIDTAIPGNTVTVGGGPVNTTPFTLTYTGYGNVAQVTIASSLTGTTPVLTPTTTTGGTDGSNTGWASITVAKLSASSVVPPTNAVVGISFIRYAPNPATPTGDVVDINTDELLIPRILPPLPELTGAVTTKVLTSNVATLTLSEAHSFIVGYTVLVENVDATFNGTYTLTAVTSTTISYAKTAANVVSVAATGLVSLVDPHAPESETDFPGLTEEERTHDGLWVKAVGGLANT